MRFPCMCTGKLMSAAQSLVEGPGPFVIRLQFRGASRPTIGSMKFAAAQKRYPIVHIASNRFRAYLESRNAQPSSFMWTLLSEWLTDLSRRTLCLCAIFSPITQDGRVPIALRDVTHFHHTVHHLLTLHPAFPADPFGYMSVPQPFLGSNASSCHYVVVKTPQCA